MANNIDRTCAMRFCLNCNSDSMHLIEWEEDGPDHWEVLLKCGNCEVFRRDTFHQLEVEDYEEWLDDCMDEIQNAWRKSEHERMKDYCAEFIVLLNHDVIMPEDF